MRYIGRNVKKMKRLMSMMLALLMLVGMALAEETPDAALGDWYALNTENEAICLTLREDGTFCYDSREGTWRKTTDGEYWLTYNSHDLLEVMERMVNSQAAEQDLTALLTETGFDVYYGSTAKRRGGTHGAGRGRTADGTNAPDRHAAGSIRGDLDDGNHVPRHDAADVYPEMGEHQVFCTIDGLTMFPGAGLESFPEGTSFPLTFEDGVLRTTIPLTVQMAASSALVKEIVVDYDLTFFQTADGSLYATLRLSDVPDNPTTMFLLVPMEKE